MSIRVATTVAEITACYPVMRELRPHLAEGQFLSRIRGQESAGYRLAYVQDANGVVAVAGFRLGENLAWGRFLYVDDLVTLSAHRSKGHGAKLLSWLKALAAKEGCEQIHLDSGIHRKEAHRFYGREGMAMASFHFAETIAPEKEVPACDAALRPGRVVENCPITWLILEDNPNRTVAFQNTAKLSRQPAEVRIWRIAAQMIQELPGLLSGTSLLSLDHDLYRQSESDPDPGSGRDVANYLATQSPLCPVIIHSTNTDAAWGMHNQLRSAGWRVEIIHHLDEAGWIETRWLALAQKLTEPKGLVS